MLHAFTWLIFKLNCLTMDFQVLEPLLLGHTLHTTYNASQNPR